MTYALPESSFRSGQKVFKSTVFRLNLSYLSGFGTFEVLPPGTLRAKGVCPQLDRLKQKVLASLLTKQTPRGLIHYKIAWQTHRETGEPHLDILLVYQNRTKKHSTGFNYLLKLCSQRASDSTPGVNIRGYAARKLNQAILNYGDKEDPEPIASPKFETKAILTENSLKTNLYQTFRSQMLKNPFHFNAHTWLHQNEYDSYIVKSGWANALSLLKAQQAAACNRLLANKSGLKEISRKQIEKLLTKPQVEQYDSWKGYAQIVEYLNQIARYGFNRPHKSKQLLVVGRPNTGKTALARKIREIISVYSFGVDNWYPAYRPNTYRMILWNEFSLVGRPYGQLLNILEGQPVDLQYKGGSVLKTDNQLIYMTSNMTLQQHIASRFKDPVKQQLAKANLGARIHQVIIPVTQDLFLLQKLVAKC